MKVAFATQDQQRVDAHFGWAKHLAVYEVNAEGSQFVQNFGFGDNLAEDGDEDKLAPKLAAIADCAIVYVAAIGGSAANLTALACARERRVGAMRDDLVVYISAQSHSSMARAARALGFRPERVRVLPVDRSFHLRVDVLVARVDI